MKSMHSSFTVSSNGLRVAQTAYPALGLSNWLEVLL